MAHPSVTPPDYNPAPQPQKVPPKPPHKVRRRVRSIWHEAPLWVHIVIVAVGALLAIGVGFIGANWPYRHRKIRPMLEDVLTSDVTFTRYHRVYYPRPGFVATGITIRRKTAPQGVPPLGHIDSMMMVGTWTDLIMFRHRVERVEITGFHATVPAIGSNANKLSFPSGSANEFSGPDTMIERLVVHNSILDFLNADGSRTSFPIRQLEILNLHKGEAFTFAADMQNPRPRGHILARGTMGPLNGKDFASTGVRGNFAFTQVNLHDVGEISGTMASRGVFNGTLRKMIVEVNEVTPDFAVQDGKPTRIDGTMRCTLDASNADLDIQAIDLKIQETQIHAAGTIEGDPKKTNLDITVDHGRADDVMRPFMHKEVPIAGPVSLKAHAYLGPPGHGFVQRLRLDGSFNVPAEKVTDEKTEKSLSDFSRRATGKDKPNTGVEPNGVASSSGKDAVSSLAGPAKIENGIASTPRLTFRVSGAEATLAGTYRFHDDAVHLTGKLKMDTDISHTSTGFKSFLLKPLAPFFKKKNAGAVIPIAVTGLPGHYKVSQDLSHNK